ncbi:hypothetical protein FKW77_000575 [Venturia effusa]|uniref:EB1 C-terminal domain-containing protein n=1 Tax=Venturia effusa TaxID=50376 RepID=A0A517LRD4_9PEZI|nr:hypothetical protein FKW77_000575 [Venturia effusa]
MIDRKRIERTTGSWVQEQLGLPQLASRSQYLSPAGGPPAGGPPASMGLVATWRPAGGAKLAPKYHTKLGAGASAALQTENNALEGTVSGLERERDFYFSKLSDTELLIQKGKRPTRSWNNKETEFSSRWSWQKEMLRMSLR